MVFGGCLGCFGGGSDLGMFWVLWDMLGVWFGCWFAGLFIFGVQPGTTPGKDGMGVGRGWGEERWGC